jgi:hypothetical protein
MGTAGGFALGYCATRAFEALGDLRRPQHDLAPDPKGYGRLRRRLMLAGIARSLAELGAIAYGPAASALAPPEGGEPRARRIALIATGLAISAALDVPTSYTEGYVLERRYGLTKQKGRDWAVDHAKGFAISTAVCSQRQSRRRRARGPQSRPRALCRCLCSPTCCSPT